MSGRTYSIYDATTGLFTGRRVHCEPEHLDSNVREGTLAIEGEYDPRSQKFDLVEKRVIAYSPDVVMLTTAQIHREAARNIHSLEMKSHRIIREHILGDPTAMQRLHELDAQIAEQRTRLIKE